MNSTSYPVHWKNRVCSRECSTTVTHIGPQRENGCVLRLMTRETGRFGAGQALQSGLENNRHFLFVFLNYLKRRPKGAWITCGMIQNGSPAALATIAMESECKLKSCKSERKQLLNYERNKEFATLADTFRVIEDKDNFLAVVHPDSRRGLPAQNPKSSAVVSLCGTMSWRG